MELFGAAVDWRRSFITTSENPFYDKFIQAGCWPLWIGFLGRCWAGLGWAGAGHAFLVLVMIAPLSS